MKKIMIVFILLAFLAILLSNIAIVITVISKGWKEIGIPGLVIAPIMLVLVSLRLWDLIKILKQEKR